MTFEDWLDQSLYGSIRNITERVMLTSEEIIATMKTAWQAGYEQGWKDLQIQVEYEYDQLQQRKGQL